MYKVQSVLDVINKKNYNKLAYNTQPNVHLGKIVSLKTTLHFYNTQYLHNTNYNVTSSIKSKQGLIIGYGSIYDRPSEKHLIPNSSYIILQTIDPEALLLYQYELLNVINQPNEYIKVLQQIYSTLNTFITGIHCSIILTPVVPLHV